VKEQSRSLLETMTSDGTIRNHFSDWDRLEKKLVLYRKGEIVVEYGDETDKLFLLLKGTIRFTSQNDDYEEYFFFDATNDGLFGEVEYVLHIPSITQSQAMNNCYCVEIPVRRNRELLDSDIRFQTFVSRVLAKKYNDLRLSSVDIETYSVRTRVIRYLLRETSQNRIRNLGLIAKTLKCSYRQLIRVLQDFCAKGWIEHGNSKGVYLLKDREALRKEYEATGGVIHEKITD